MNKIFKTTSGENLIFTSENLAITKLNFQDYDEMKQNSEKVSLKKSFQIIPKRNLYSIKYNSDSSQLIIDFSSEINSTEKMNLKFSSNDEMIHFANELSAEFQLNKTEQLVKKNKILFTNGVAIIGTVLIYILLLTVSFSDNDEGLRKSAWVRKIVGSVIDGIGTIGFTLIFICFLGYFIYRLISQLKNPASEIVFKKVIKK